MKKLMSFMLILLVSTTLVNAELNKVTKAVATLVPLNVATTFLGYKCIQWGNANKYLAEDVKQNPQNNLDYIRDFCANYKEIISTGKHVITKHDSALYLKFIDVKNKPDDLKEFGYYISTLMKEKSNNLVAVGVILPLLVLASSSVYVYNLSK
ncbi:MAG: hypothetical protein P4L22_01690 [Candidatus Babeliales bacterium]|nr:hypothetical protein [Candidatus Babeliales bacterium]